MPVAHQQQQCNSPDPLDVLRLRAWAVAKLVDNSLLFSKADAVDALWKYAEDNGIVTKLGVDAIQAVIAEAFTTC